MFWSFPVSHFSYFFIWAIVAGYLTLWLEQVAHLNSGQAGIVFSMMAAMSLLFQPFFGFFSDRLVMKKKLVIIILIAGALIGPFFQWFFIPVLNATNGFTVAVFTGLYLSFVLNGGVGVIEQYIQRASVTNNFEYGRSRVGGIYCWYGSIFCRWTYLFNQSLSNFLGIICFCYSLLNNVCFL